MARRIGLRRKFKSGERRPNPGQSDRLRSRHILLQGDRACPLRDTMCRAVGEASHPGARSLGRSATKEELVAMIDEVDEDGSGQIESAPGCVLESADGRSWRMSGIRRFSW